MKKALLAVAIAVLSAGCGMVNNDLKCAMNCGCYNDAQWRNPTPDMQKHFAATPACQGTEVWRF